MFGTSYIDYDTVMSGFLQVICLGIAALFVGRTLYLFETMCTGQWLKRWAAVANTFLKVVSWCGFVCDTGSTLQVATNPLSFLGVAFLDTALFEVWVFSLSTSPSESFTGDPMTSEKRM